MGAHFFVRVNKSSTSFSPNILSMARENVFPLVLLLLSLIFPLDNRTKIVQYHIAYTIKEKIYCPHIPFGILLAM